MEGRWDKKPTQTKARHKAGLSADSAAFAALFRVLVLISC